MFEKEHLLSSLYVPGTTGDTQGPMSRHCCRRGVQEAREQIYDREVTHMRPHRGGREPLRG